MGLTVFLYRGKQHRWWSPYAWRVTPAYHLILALIGQDAPAKSLTFTTRTLDITRTINPASTTKGLVGMAN